jgi:hypothetical protein
MLELNPTAGEYGIELPEGLWFDAYGISIKYNYAHCVGSELVGRFATKEEAQVAVDNAIQRIRRITFYPTMFIR